MVAMLQYTIYQYIERERESAIQLTSVGLTPTILEYVVLTYSRTKMQWMKCFVSGVWL